MSRLGVCVFVILTASRVSGAASALDDQDLKHLSRYERARLLSEQTWEIQAQRVRGELKIDGRVEEEAWAHTEPVTSFYQRESNEGLPATEPTHVWVLYDDTNLYLAFRCFDSEPGRPRARTMFRDENIAADDAVAVMIDAYNDRRSAVFLATNANGVVFDMLQNGQESRTRNLNWDTVWHSRGRHIEQGWEVEIAVPFKSLRFDPPAGDQEVVFGIGFKRNLPRKNEETYWPFVGNDSTWYAPSEMGHLRGMHGIRSGRSLEVRPYILGATSQNVILDERKQRKDVGIDAKWGITTGLTADFTANTDFAQEEVDVQQINFTRFSLFFPEKRQIFLESQRSFLFGVQREADLIFTRRIGLSRDGDILPIYAGARLSGRQGAYNVGIMNMHTDDLPSIGVPSENFTVVRLRRDILNRSNIGVLFTNRQDGNRFNRVYGADLNLFLGRDWSFESYFAAVDENEETGTGARSGYAKLEYRTDRWRSILRYLDIGENFRPGIGFVRRPDSRQTRGEFRFSPRPRVDFIRQFHFIGTLDYIPNQRGVLETREAGGEFQTTFENGASLSFRYTDVHEFLENPFRLRSDVTIDAGAYDFRTLETRFRSFGRAHRRVTLGYTTGGFFDGERDTIDVNAAVRLNKHIDVSGNYAINWVDLPAGKFQTQLASARFQVAFRTDLVLMSLFQYNTETEQLASNIRFNWIPKPGSDFFVVYNELDGWGAAFGVKNRSLSVKLNYLLAF